jgi:hypothetical protein
MIDESKNTGLTSNFSITPNGAFMLQGGVPKAEDNVTVLVAFIGFKRVYYQDFCIDILWLMQAAVSTVIQYKAYIGAMFSTTFRKYCPFLTLIGAVPTYSPEIGRKEIGISVVYNYNLPSVESTPIVRFINV